MTNGWITKSEALALIRKELKCNRREAEMVLAIALGSGEVSFSEVNAHKFVDVRSGERPEPMKRENGP